MKFQLRSFLSGALCAALILGLAVSALAISGNVSFNRSAIKFNGEVISEAGEGYTLDNGCVAPASITYTDEKGGGTTFLPARRVSELLGVDIGWDAAAGAVTIGKAEKPATPDTTANVPDYSDWSAEDEAAYQEFKGLFIDIHQDLSQEGVWVCWFASGVDLYETIERAESLGFIQRLASEIRNDNSVTQINFGDSSSGLLQPYKLTQAQHERP